MPKACSRKDFLKLGALAGSGFLLGSCGKSATDVAPTPGRPPNEPPADDQKAPSVEIIQKNDLRYDDLRQGFNKRISRFPLAIALCTSTQEVAEAVAYARKNKLAVAIKSGGHSMEGLSSNDGGLVINLSKMNAVEWLDDQQIKVGPGCTLSHLYDEILPKQRIIPAGSCGTVGLGGLTMGGGYGLFSRKYGLTCDSLLEATVVDGHGTIHSTRQDPELLWAIRGGGVGNFGVVTEMTFRSYPAPPSMAAFHFKARRLDSKRATHLLEKWFDFAGGLPDTAFSAFVLNGRTLTVLVTNYDRINQETTRKLANDFRRETDEFSEGNDIELSRALKSYYGSLVPVYFKNSSAGFYRTFGDIGGFIPDVLEKVIRNPGMIYQVNTLGGNIANPDFEKDSCFPHRHYDFLSELQAYWERPSGEEKLTKVSQEILGIFRSNGITTQYINYCSLDFDNWESAYYGSNYPRLQAVKRRYDPENFVRHPQSVKV